MPKQKDLKRLVRTRMSKTGESYTTARAQLLEKSDKGNRIPESKYAEVAGMSDEAVRKRTGKSWKEWVRALDAVGAAKMPHRDIARQVYENFDISGWWAQMVTVSYERIRGLREVGQRRGGKYEANKSKTFPVAVSKLYGAFGDARKRKRWLPDVALKIRTSQRDRSMRITWPDDTKVDLWFTSKGAAKSSVSVQHRELAQKSDIARVKDYWGERLGALAEMWRNARHRRPGRRPGRRPRPVHARRPRLGSAAEPMHFNEAQNPVPGGAGFSSFGPDALKAVSLNMSTSGLIRRLAGGTST